jgi:hypothetical protein
MIRWRLDGFPAVPPLRRTPLRQIAPACCAVLTAALLGCRLFAPAAPAAEPDWVVARDRPAQSIRFISVVGTAIVGRDPEAAMAQADRQARQRLANAVADYTRTAAAEFLEYRVGSPAAGSPEAADFADALAAEVSADILRQSTRQDSWEGPSGSAHVFYRLPVATVDAKLPEKMRYALARFNPQGDDPENAPALMQDFLARRLRERLAESARSRPVAPEMPPERRVPLWLEAGRHEDYPPERYITGIGVGQDPLSAEVSARRELVSEIQSRLASILRALNRPGAEGVLVANVRAVGSVPASFAEEQLPAIQPVATWHDAVTETCYALAVLDRTVASVVYPQRIGRALEQHASLSASGRNQQDAENYAASLRDSLDALRAARAALELQLQALALAPEADAGKLGETVSEPIVERATADVKSLLSQMTLEKTDGDDQWTAPGVPPPRPLQVRLTAGREGRPVPGLPVRLVPEPEGEALAAAAVTDEGGVAQWHLSRPPAAGNPFSTIVAELDLAQLVSGLETDRLTRPSVTFRCIVRSHANASFAVFIREAMPDGRFVASPWTERLREAMATEHYQLLPESEVAEHANARAVPGEPTENDVLAAFAGLRASIEPGRFLALVFGTVQTQLVETVPTTEGELYMVHCQYAVRVLDPDLPQGRRTMLRISGTGSGAYAGDQREAIRRARADAAATACAQLIGGLRERLGATAARP